MHAPAEISKLPAPIPTEPTGLACLVIIARRHGLHLSVSQLIHKNVLGEGEVTVHEIVKCATSVALRAKVLELNWGDLGRLKKALPAIVQFRNGGSMVLLKIEGDGDGGFAVLQDPNGENALLRIDRARLEDAWTRQVILVKRNYDIDDEEQPFGLGLLVAALFRERWIVRDLTVAAVMLGFLALSPIMFWRLLMDRVIYYQAYYTFYVLCAAMLILILFEMAFTYLRGFLVVNLTNRIDIKLRSYVFDRVLNLPMVFFEQTQTGRIFHDIMELLKLRRFMVGQLLGTILDATVLLFFLPIMFFFSAAMTFWVLAFLAIMVAVLLAMLPHYRKQSGEVERAETERASFLVQTVVGIRTVKSLALDARQRHTHDIHVARVGRLHFKADMTANLMQSAVLPLERLAISGAVALGAYLVLTTNSQFTVAALFTFLMLSQRVAAPLMSIAKLIDQLDEARIAVATISQLVNQTPEEGRTGTGVLTPLRGSVAFSGVTFTYAGAPRPALEGVTFEISEGTTLGIMGRSGSGKTTITRLLQRLHSDYEGLIKIDGIDVREFDVDHLRRSLGVVLQDNFLFSGTIRENIAAAKSDATFEEVVRAARLAGAEEFIDKLPRGYETYIDEGSPNLSGGQKQRLAIARALIVNPRILILDEATSSLDAESEAIVNANLARIARERTLIVISHRLTSLVQSDAILVLERGRVHDIGKHGELLARCDIYGDLWHEQTRNVFASNNKRETPARKPNLVR
jgi:subfamily B ATP-binding cassette protein HlyB/CyaB